VRPTRPHRRHYLLDWFLGGTGEVASPEALAIAASATTITAALAAVVAGLATEPTGRPIAAALAAIAALASTLGLATRRRGSRTLRLALELVATLVIGASAALVPESSARLGVAGTLGIVAAVAFATTPAWATVLLGVVGTAVLGIDAVLAPSLAPWSTALLGATITATGIVAGWLARLAATGHLDPLTGATNRRGYQVRVEPMLADADRSGSPIGIIMLDLDGFKRLNERIGHLAADRVLARFVACLSQHLRPSDLLVRWGGDEFLIVLEVSSRDNVADVVARLTTSCGETASFSAGSAVRGPGEPIERAILRADEELLRVKRARHTAESN
jgi:diguanylate cyclase (GGDEF)-like protein